MPEHVKALEGLGNKHRTKILKVLKKSHKIKTNKERAAVLQNLDAPYPTRIKAVTPPLAAVGLDERPVRL